MSPQMEKLITDAKANGWLVDIDTHHCEGFAPEDRVTIYKINKRTKKTTAGIEISPDLTALWLNVDLDVQNGFKGYKNYRTALRIK